MAARICEVLARPWVDVRAVTFFKFVSLKKQSNEEGHFASIGKSQYLPVSHNEPV